MKKEGVMIPALATTPLREVKLREAVRMPPDAPLLDAVTMLRERRRGAVIVQDAKGTLLGIFTEHDLIERVDHTSHDWHILAVAECMTKSPRTSGADASIADAIQVMRKGGFRNLPIVDADGHATGIVTVRDILEHITEQFPKELLNLPPDPGREASRRWGG